MEAGEELWQVGDYGTVALGVIVEFEEGHR